MFCRPGIEPLALLHRIISPRAAVLIVCLSVSLSIAADPIDDYVQSEMQKQGIPGLSVLIVRKGDVTKLKGYGLANVEHKAPVSADTIFQSGSVGKQFTAAAILLLSQRGKLSLDDPLAKHFTQAPSSWHRITIRQLLSHTSGLKDYEGNDELDLHRDYTEEELLHIAMHLPIEFEPGTQWSFSNSGYVVLGILISQLAEEHWSDFVKKHIFEAVGMNTAQVITESDIVPNRAAGYERGKDGQLVNQAWVAPSLNRIGDGALYFSVRDLAAWDTALRSRKLLSRESYAAWWTPIAINESLTYPHGFGWDIEDQRGRRVFQHSGSWQGFSSFIARYVDNDITIAVLANVNDAQASIIAHQIAGLVEKNLMLPDIDSPGAGEDKRRTQRLRGVLEAWASWRKSEYMADALANTLSRNAWEASDRREIGEQIRQATNFVWLADDDVADQSMRRRGEKVERIAYFALETPEKRIRYRFYLTSDNRVVDFVRG